VKTNRFILKWNAPDHGESWTENHLHSGRKRPCKTTMMVPLKWQTQHFIPTISPPADLLQLPFFAINGLICCPISDKMVLSIVSACLIAYYLYPNFCESRLVSFSVIHFHKTSPTLLHGIYFLVFRMPNKWK